MGRDPFGAPPRLPLEPGRWRRPDAGPSRGRPPRLLDQLRQALRLRHRSRRTEEAYVDWVKRFILFHGKRHPGELGAREITEFLNHLATERQVTASTQNQALKAIVFLYRRVLERHVADLDGLVRARKSRRLPVVLTRREVLALLDELSGTQRLVASLLYGSGLRLLEALRLRVKDVDFERHEIVVRQGKGRKDRVAPLPGDLRPRPSGAPGVGAEASRARPRGRLGIRAPSRGAGAEVPGGIPRVGVAVGLSGHPPPSRCARRGRATASSARDRDPAGGEASGPGGWDRQARQLSHAAPQLRDPPARARRRRPHGAGTPRPVDV
jgi:Phage integrase, N-terminal SAM-like domain/Phage integrase family